MDTMTIELPELGLVGATDVSAPAELSLAPRVTRGGPTVEIKSRVVFGGPDLARMLPREDDDRHLADRRTDSEFWSVLMSLSIESEDPETISSAWLKVQLDATDGGSPPIAFAMEPSHEEAGEQIERSGSVEATIKLFKLSGGEKRTYTARHDEVQALNRLRADPAWELAPAPGRPLRPTDFVLVVKGRRGVPAHGKVSFGAEVEWRGKLFQRHEASWAGDEVTFSLEPTLATEVTT